MWTLGFETTTSTGSVALLEDERAAAEFGLETRSYGTELFRALDWTLAQTRLRLSDIDLFAVADGPGSFTGVRLGLTAVKGLIEALHKPAVGVSTLRAVALRTPALTALSAGRDEVYWGMYIASGENQNEEAEGVESLAAFGQRLDSLGSRPAYTADARLASLFPKLQLAPPRLAAEVARLGRSAWLAGGGVDALRLDARYLKRSDAEGGLESRVKP